MQPPTASASADPAADPEPADPEAGYERRVALAEERGPSRGRRPRLLLLRDLVVVLVVAALAATLIKTFLVESFYIPSESMENTLVDNDRVIVDELVPGLIPLQRGDVVVFSDPGGWLPSSTSKQDSPIGAAGQWLLGLVGLSTTDRDDHLIKRVIGLPGDHVVCCNALGQTTVNGVPLDEPYVKASDDTARSQYPFDITVRPGTVWVEGDNRANSEDSRFHPDTPTKGFVPIKDIVGRAFLLSWPVSRWSVLSNYPATFAGVPDPG
jgi:signal peptidase I